MPRSAAAAPPWALGALGALLFAAAAAPPLTDWLKLELARHILAQFPMLLGAGYCFGRVSANRWEVARKEAPLGTAPALVLAGFSLAFWMMPRWLDAAVDHAPVDTAKLLSLTLLAGFPLGWAWPRVSPLVQLFVWANGVSMLFVMGWFYLSAPYRLCNNYLQSDQATLGLWLMCLSALLAAAVTAAAFFAPKSRGT